LSRPPEILPLTGLRGIAAATIAVTHLSVALKLTIAGFPVNVSPIGMPLFFTLSGFVVHYVYASGLVANYTAEVKDFAIARFARIYPLFALLLVFYALGEFGLALLRHPGILVSFATLTASWWYWTLDGRALIDTPYGISWSISTEAFFYVAYAAGLYRMAGIRDPRICAGLLLVFCVGSLVSLFVFYRLATESGIDFADPFYRWMVYVSPYFHLLEFIGGCLACQLVMAAKERRWLIRYLIDYPVVAALLAPAAMVCLAAILYRCFERPAQRWLRRLR
jgi:peptidoglycan/LPS O-acetylase OafA/YrhL